MIYLSKLHDLLRGVTRRPGVLHSLVLIGGVLLVALLTFALDLIGFVLFLFFVLVSSAILPRDHGPARPTEARSA